MKRTIYLFFALALFLPLVYATPNIGTGFTSGVDLTTTINPNGNMGIFKCGVSTGLGSSANSNYTREGAYLFEGEKIFFDILVVVPNGIAISPGNYKVKVSMTEGNISKLGNNVIAICSPYISLGQIPKSCNAIIDGETLNEFDEDLMRYYTCEYTVKSPIDTSTTLGIKGEKYLSVEVLNNNGNKTKISEDEVYYLNPSISLKIEGVTDGIKFNNLKPGDVSYSNIVTVTNTANKDTDVNLNIFLSGSDFMDNVNPDAKCPGSYTLSLDRFRYYAINGVYQTIGDPRPKDSEGYLAINKGSFGNQFYNKNELIQLGDLNGKYYDGSVLKPNNQVYITYKLDLPKPCIGNFDNGQMYIWAEAI